MPIWLAIILIIAGVFAGGFLVIWLIRKATEAAIGKGLGW